MSIRNNKTYPTSRLIKIQRWLALNKQLHKTKATITTFMVTLLWNSSFDDMFCSGMTLLMVCFVVDYFLI